MRFPRPGIILLLNTGCLVLFPRPAAPDIAQTTQDLNLRLQALGKLSVPGSIALTSSGPGFNAFQGMLPVRFRVRTSASGAGLITLQVSSEFLPTGGPSSAAGALKYTCTGATLGAGCPGTQTASPIAQTPVLNVPAGACTGGGPPCSGSDPNSVEINFVLDNDPAYATGNYSAQVLLTVSAT